MKKHLARHYNTKATPQTQAIPGSNQVPNNAGGFAFEVSDWMKLDRFLILGTEGGTYYVSEHKLTVDNCDAILRCLKQDGKRVVDRIVEISDAGRAPKNDYALYALALATKHGDDATRKYAFQMLPKVARIGTHLFHFAEYREALGGWGRGARNAVARWYLNREPEKLAQQLVKYRQRDGWSHRDLLRLAHPHTNDSKLNNLFRWVVEKPYEKELLPQTVEGFLKIQETKDAKTAAKLIRQYGLTREAVPTELLTETAVWEALLEKMPMTAMIRNLANMTRLGVLAPMNSWSKHVVSAIEDKEQLKNSRIHPIAILAAIVNYEKGRSGRDINKTWTPIAQIIDALDEAFYLSFENVVPTGKNFMLAIDISGSMDMGEVSGIEGMTPRVASAALAMVTARSEKNYMFKGFCHTFQDLRITKKSRLQDVVKYMQGLKMGATDCSLPMNEARANKWDIDVFAVYTDSETYAGRYNHPCQALEEYNRAMGKSAKLIVVGMNANNFSIADPKNPLMLDVVGFDTNTPAAISEFIAA